MLPSFVEALKDGCHGKYIILNWFDHSFSSHYGVDDELIPNPLVDLGLTSLFVVTYFVVAFEPDGPKRNVFKNMPNLDHFTKFIRKFFTKQCLLPIEVVIIARSTPHKFMHNERGPSPRPHGLDVVP